MGIVGGLMMGLGASMLGSKKASTSMTEAHTAMAVEKPAVPDAPTGVDAAEGTSATNNALMEEAREKEKQQAALRRLQAQEIFTSGLGATGLADTAKKSLLGG